MILQSIKEKKVVIGLILICLFMIFISYKQIFNLFDTSINNLMKNKLASKQYWRFNTISSPTPEIKKDEVGNTFYIFKKGEIQDNLLYVSIRSGYSEKECPNITFTYFHVIPGGIILEKETDGNFNRQTYTLIDYVESISNNTFVIENDVRYNLKNITYTIENLLSGEYRILIQQKNLSDKYLGFKIYDNIPTEWSLNEDKLQLLDPLSFLVEPDMDTRWYYVNNVVNNIPVLEISYKIYKDGKWSEDRSMNNSSGEIYLENRVCKTKNKFFFRSPNPVREWIENELVPDSSGIDEFIHSQDFKNLFADEFGDSLAIKFGISIEPMLWSKYNYQNIYSDYYVLPSEKIFESFLEKSE